MRKLFPDTFQDFNVQILKSQHFQKMSKFRLIIDIRTGFKVPPSCASVSQLPAALRRPQKKHALELWSMYLVDFVDLVFDFIEKWTSFTEKCVKFTKLCSKISFCVFARRSRRSRQSHGSGGMKCCSDPPFHTRRGSG